MKNRYEIVLRNKEGMRKIFTSTVISFPEAASVAYRHRADLRFEYEILSISRVEE